MSSYVSLARQLALLDHPAPVDFDPEAINDLDNVAEQAGDTGREHYLNVGPPTLRSKVHDEPGLKYEGMRISRRQLENSDDEDLSDHLPDEEQGPVTSEGDVDNSDEEMNGDPDDQSVREHPSESVKIVPHAALDNDPSATLKRARIEEREKGKAVVRQLAMYDSLLDARIRLQKCVTSTNKLPEASRIPSYLMDNESRRAADSFLSESLSLTDELFDLQEKLMTSNGTPAKKRRKIDESNPDRDWEVELQKLSSNFSELEASLHSYLLTTLQKWSNKVLAIAPSALLPSSRTKFSRNGPNQVKSAPQLVDEALLEREKLVARTRIWRGKGERLGLTPVLSLDTDTNETNVDVFDDTDFYQALLRDVIDARAGAEGLDGLTADWRATQKQRKKARKNTVETRASKGRKLRFEIHEKLQNFMAPAPPPGGHAWHEAQIDELFASLLGKGFSDVHDDQDAGMPVVFVDVEQTLKDGFRVFG